MYPENEIHLSEKGIKFRVEDQFFQLDDIDVIWKRRFNGNFSQYIINKKDFIQDSPEIIKYLKREVKTIEDYILNFARDLNIKIINDYDERIVDKLYQMKMANHFQLNTPKFLVSNKVNAVQQFCSGTNTITKPISNYGYFFEKNRIFTTGTNTFRPEHLDDSTETIFPSFVQEQIISAGELKCLLVGDKIFASLQAPNEGLISSDIKRDYRKGAIHLSGYDIPDELKSKLLRLLKYYKLDVCTFDLIMTDKKEFRFIEINSDGIMLFYAQFIDGLDLVEEISNYIIEHKN
ncbi:MAG: hypothetical protein AAGA77_22365 [Bacteroidota bacterium]